MSGIKYGLISETDATALEKTIDFICGGMGNDIINITEIGVYGGGTGRGICEYIKSKGNNYWITGIDSFKDKETVIFPYNEMIYGDSNEVYNKIEDNSQHLIFVDGCHCFSHVVSDFFCYAPKVKVGGYFAFHDTGKHIKPFKDFQHGDKNNPDAYISVRKALSAIGVLGSGIAAGKMWERAFDEFDIENEAGGIVVFKKLN